MSPSRKSSVDWDNVLLDRVLVGFDLLSGERFVGVAVDWNSSYIRVKCKKFPQVLDVSRRHIARLLLLVK